MIKPSISRSRIRTANVASGPIEATISASGTVIPEFEQVLSSPVKHRFEFSLEGEPGGPTRFRIMLDGERY